MTACLLSADDGRQRNHVVRKSQVGVLRTSQVIIADETWLSKARAANSTTPWLPKISICRPFNFIGKEQGMASGVRAIVARIAEKTFS